MWNFFKRKNKEDEPTEDYLEDEELDLKIREPREVANRILALFAVIGKVNQADNTDFKSWFENNSIRTYLSKEETEFMDSSNIDEQTLISNSWRSEALVSLLWGAKIIEQMPSLNQEFDVFSINELSELINNPVEFQNNIDLRPDQELNKMESELFNQHWRVRDAQLFNKEMPAELNPSIVYERRYGMSWLVGWGVDWDNVPTDT